MTSRIFNLFGLLGTASCVVSLPLFAVSIPNLLAQDRSVEAAASAKSIGELRAQRNAELATRSMDPKVKEVWDRYINAPEGKHDPADLTRLQANWDQVEAAAHRGEIKPEQNSRFLRDNGQDMKARLQRAGAAEKLDVSLQTPSGAQKTYSDSDGHLRAKAGGEMTAEQIQNVRKRFNEEFNRDLRAIGEPELENPAAKTRTDGMPVTEDPQLFKQAKQVINQDGGMMYDSHDAVKKEIANRTGGETSLKENVAYGQEQIRQIRSHHQEAAHKVEEGRALVNNNPPDSPEHRRGLRLLEEAHGEGASAGGKYEKRLTGNTNATAEQTGGERYETGSKRAEAVAKVNQTRDVSVNKESSTLSSSYENEIFNQQRSNVKNLAASGNLPEAAEMARNATPNQRGQMLEEARGAILEREAASLRAAGNGLDEAEIQSIARQRADRQTAQLAEEMRRNSTPDRWNPAENQWELNSTYEKTGAAGRGARLGGTADAGDALSGMGKGRPSWDTGPSDISRINPEAKVTPIDGRAPKAGPNYLGAVTTGVEIGGQVLERSSRQMGEIIDENRDIKLEDVKVVAEDLVPGVAGYKGSQQALLGRQVERLERQERIRQLRDKENRTLEEVRELIRLEHDEKNNPDTASGNATAMVKEGIAGRFADMEEQAKKEGRERPEFFRDGVPMFGRMAKDALNAVNPINQMGAPIFEGEAEASTFDERGDWAAQKAAMTDYVNQKAAWADKRTRDKVSELDRILNQEDMSNPANQQRVDALLSDIRANQDEINKLSAMADKQLGEVDADKSASLRGIARSQPDLDALRDYAKQMGHKPVKVSERPAGDSWEAGASNEVKELAHGVSAEDQGWGGSGNEVTEITSKQAKDPAAAEWERKVNQRADQIRRKASRREGGAGGYINEPRQWTQPGEPQRGDTSGVTDFVSDLIKRRGQSAAGSAGTTRPRCTGDAARDTVLSQIGGAGCEGQAGTWGGGMGDPTNNASGSAFRSPGVTSGARGGQVPGFSSRGAIPEVPATPAARSGVSGSRSSGGPGQGEFSVAPPKKRGPQLIGPCRADGAYCLYEDGWHDTAGRVYPTVEALKRANGLR
jgi:hypothetical protein